MDEMVCFCWIGVYSSLVYFGDIFGEEVFVFCINEGWRVEKMMVVLGLSVFFWLEVLDLVRYR